MIRPDRFVVDTSVWIDHLRSADHALVGALRRGAVLSHPFVIGELACGPLPERDAVLGWLHDLPAAPVAGHDEVLRFIEAQELIGRGVGYIDVHLLASAALGCVRLWTRDVRLGEVAEELGLGGGSS